MKMEVKERNDIRLEDKRIEMRERRARKDLGKQT